MKILRKLSIGSANGIRGGLKDIKERTRVLTVVGIANAYKEKTSDTMGTSYGFSGEFRAVNMHGEPCTAAICYLPEPAQGMLKTALDNGSINVEFAVHFYAIPDADAIKGYVFEMESLTKPQPSNRLAELATELGVEVSEPQKQLNVQTHQAEAAKGAKALAAPTKKKK